MEIKQFKEELRGRVYDFSLTAYLINLNTARKDTAKEAEIAKKYLKLEKWILNNQPNDTTKTSSIVQPDDSMDF